MAKQEITQKLVAAKFKVEKYGLARKNLLFGISQRLNGQAYEIRKDNKTLWLTTRNQKIGIELKYIEMLGMEIYNYEPDFEPILNPCQDKEHDYSMLDLINEIPFLRPSRYSDSSLDTVASERTLVPYKKVTKQKEKILTNENIQLISCRELKNIIKASRPKFPMKVSKVVKRNPSQKKRKLDTKKVLLVNNRPKRNLQLKRKKVPAENSVSEMETNTSSESSSSKEEQFINSIEIDEEIRLKYAKKMLYLMQLRSAALGNILEEEKDEVLTVIGELSEDEENEIIEKVNDEITEEHDECMLDTAVCWYYDSEVRDMCNASREDSEQAINCDIKVETIEMENLNYKMAIEKVEENATDLVPEAIKDDLPHDDTSSEPCPDIKSSPFATEKQESQSDINNLFPESIKDRLIEMESDSITLDDRIGETESYINDLIPESIIDDHPIEMKSDTEPHDGTGFDPSSDNNSSPSAEEERSLEETPIESLINTISCFEYDYMNANVVELKRKRITNPNLKSVYKIIKMISKTYKSWRSFKLHLNIETLKIRKMQKSEQNEDGVAGLEIKFLSKTIIVLELALLRKKFEKFLGFEFCSPNERFALKLIKYLNNNIQTGRLDKYKISHYNVLIKFMECVVQALPTLRSEELKKLMRKISTHHMRKELLCDVARKQRKSVEQIAQALGLESGGSTYLQSLYSYKISRDQLSVLLALRSTKQTEWSPAPKPQPVYHQINVMQIDFPTPSEVEILPAPVMGQRIAIDLKDVTLPTYRLLFRSEFEIFQDVLPWFYGLILFPLVVLVIINSPEIANSLDTLYTHIEERFDFELVYSKFIGFFKSLKG